MEMRELVDRILVEMELTPGGVVDARDLLAELGIPAATLAGLRSGELVAVPHHKHMTDLMGEAIAAEANCCGGIAYDIYRAIIEHQLAAAPAPGGERE